MSQDEFISIIKEHQKLIYKICHSYCADPQQRRDLEQEILLQLWVAMKRYNGNVKLSTWIYKIALNTAIGFYHRTQKYKAQLLNLNQSIIALEIPNKEEEEHEKIALLYHYVQQLSANEKALILLYFDKVKNKEIAEILGISESNVSTKIFRIKNRLKTQLLNHQKTVES